MERMDGPGNECTLGHSFPGTNVLENDEFEFHHGKVLGTNYLVNECSLYRFPRRLGLGVF